MSFRQIGFRLPWQSVKASPRPANESSIRSSEPTDEATTSYTVPNIRQQPVQSPEIKSEEPSFASPQAPERSEGTMPPSQSRKAKQVHPRPPSHSRGKNQTRPASKPPPSPSKATPQSSVASTKSPSASGKASPSHDTSKPSSPAAKTSPSQNTSKPSSPAGKASPSPAGKASPSQDASKPSSPATPRSRVASKPPSPSQTSSKNHLNSKPTSQSKPRADSQPSSSSRSAFPPQPSSIPRSPSQSQENSRQQPSKKTSQVQSPSDSSIKSSAQSTSQQHIEPPAAFGDQTTNEIISHPTNRSPQSPQARPESSESQLQTKSKQSPKPDLKPVEPKASEDQPETKEELTSKNTSNLHPDQDFHEIPIQTVQTIENDQELESEEESQENEEIKNDKEDLAQITNALQTNASKSTLITSPESPPPFKPEKRDSQQEETMEDLSKAFQKLKIKYTDEENPKSFTTLIGENKGASMNLNSSEAKRHSSIHINREYKSDPDQSHKKSTEIEENFSHETPQDSRTEEDSPLELYININVQGINNSILSDSSFTENNPGIKLKFSRESTKSEDESQSHHAQKATYTVKSAERLTYEPTVRRRCLGGLLMESSDSELDNPEKPPRHGCRYRRSRKGKEDEIL